MTNFKKTALIVFSILQATLNFIPGIGNFSYEETYATSAIGDPRIIPSNYTFAIWAFLLPASIINAIYTSFYAKDSNSLAIKTSNMALLLFVTTSFYAVVARFKETAPLTAIVFVPAVIFLIQIIIIIKNNTAISKKDYNYTVPVLSVYAAWGSVAVFSNFASSLLTIGYKGQPLNETIWSIIVLILAIIITTLIVKYSKNPWYLAGATWAFIGIAVSGYTKNFIDILILALFAIFINSFIYHSDDKTKLLENQI
jgi:translocator protein